MMPSSASLIVGFGIGRAGRKINRAATSATTAKVMNRCAEVVVTGVDPARGKINATSPSRTRIEISARSVIVRPHGGSKTSNTQQATNPTGGNIQRSTTDTAATIARMTFTRLPVAISCLASS